MKTNANIHDTRLLDALKSPIFKAHNEAQPFNENMLRPWGTVTSV